MRTNQTSQDHRAEGIRPAARRPGSSGGGGKPLSRDQKAAICQLAKIAFDRQDALGLVEVDCASQSARLAEWRRAQQLAAVGIDSLTECRNEHFRTLRAHFSTLAGREDRAYRDYTRTGRVRDRGPAEDTHEAREATRKLILDELLAHGHRCDPRRPEFNRLIAEKIEANGGMITQNYVIAIAKAKCRGRKIDSLTAEELRQILYTLRNRIASREGRGSRYNRNKGQRRTR